MWKFLLPFAAFVALAVLFAFGLNPSRDIHALPSPLIGKPAPQFTLPDLLVQPGSLSTDTLKGHWSVVNVWGTWCVTCREEHQTLLQIAREGRVPIIGIDWKDDDGDARRWLSELGNPYQRVGVDREGRVAIDWGVYAAPESFLVNPAGIVVYKQVGALTPQIWQQEFLARLP